MAKQLSKTGIGSGDIIEPGHITQSIDALTGEGPYDITISGSLSMPDSSFIVDNISASVIEANTFIGDISADEIRTPALIGGVASTLANASSSITSEGYAKFVSASIGGWDVDTGSIQSPNMIMRPEGIIQTKNFASSQTGWRISAEGNGTAEFENARIRGTLSTTTFEKETVNAVGGQLWVVNSTTITGSDVTAAATTMSVANASGFSAGEILLAKKVDNTGFSTEYIRVNSSSIDGDGSGASETFGRIMVTRGYGQGTSGDFVGDLASAPQAYSEGQVLVSTGKVGTGFIKLNANPNDLETPYMDITERTGNGIFDVELKARLGDLSGLANSDYVFNSPNPGFGLATDNVFLQGGIKATFGEIGGFAISATTISSSNDNLILKSSGQITASQGFLFGDKASNQYIAYEGSTLTVKGDLSVDTISTPAGLSSTLASSSIKPDGFARFTSASIGGFVISEDEIKSSNDNLRLKANGNLTASNAQISGKITSTEGTIGGFTLGNNSLTATDFILNASTATMFLGSGTSRFVASPAGLQLGDTNFNNAPFSVTNTGVLKATSGTIGGFTLAANEIRSSDNSLRLKSSGQITGSKVLLEGGTIGGFDLSSDEIKSSDNSLRLKASGQITASSIFLDGDQGGVKASKMELSDYLVADLVMYRIVTITSTNKSQYYQNYTSQGKNFTKLLLDGSQGGDLATQVRINSAPDYPFGQIITPSTGLASNSGDSIQFECATTVYIAKKSYSDIFNQFRDVFFADAADSFYQYFQPKTIGSTTYGSTVGGDQSLWQLNSGMRVLFQKSVNDYRPIAISNFNIPGGSYGTTNFYSGLHTSNGPIHIGGGTTATANTAYAFETKTNFRSGNILIGGKIDSGQVNIATDLSGYALNITNDGNNANRYGIRLQVGQDTQSSTNYYMGLFDGNGSSVAFVSSVNNSVTWGTFTGVHDGYVVETDSPDSRIDFNTGSIYPMGTILVTTKSEFKENQGLQAEHRFISSSTFKDKRVLGIYYGELSKEALGDGYEYKHQVASLGDGPILVCNQTGNIENGDYITTASGSGGYGCKQDDDLLHNYTVAKALEDVDWEYEPLPYKIISATYHCG